MEYLKQGWMVTEIVAVYLKLTCTNYTPKTPQICGKLSILPACCNLLTSYSKLVIFIKLQQAC